MTHTPLAWIGLAGIAPDDNPRALYWQERLVGLSGRVRGARPNAQSSMFRLEDWWLDNGPGER